MPAIRCSPGCWRKARTSAWCACCGGSASSCGTRRLISRTREAGGAFLPGSRTSRSISAANSPSRCWRASAKASRFMRSTPGSSIRPCAGCGGRRSSVRIDHLPGDVYLTYCTNIHAGERWSEVRASLEAHVPAIKARVAPDRSMGLGLRLSAIAAEELANPAALAEFRKFLADRELYIFTINAFPYGPFHGRRVKEDVYQPDWLTPQRLAYTDRVAGILAALLPEGQTGSVSTVPGTFKPLGLRAGAPAAIAANIARHTATLVDISKRTGQEIVLALEPE